MSELIKLTQHADPKGTVIFVHGLGGHGYNTWRRAKISVADDETFWPVWFAQDSKDIDVATLDYDAPLTGWQGQAMSLEDRAENITALLLTHPEVFENPTVFVCHSLGGIIIKRVLLNLNERSGNNPASQKTLSSVRGVYFLATPHTGSGKASLGDKLRSIVWPSELTRALVREAPTLRQYNNSYRAFANEHSDRIQHRAFFETRSTILGKIVSASAADPGISGVVAIPADGNHFTIAKPQNRKNLIYNTVHQSVEEIYSTDKNNAEIQFNFPNIVRSSGNQKISSMLRALRLIFILFIFSFGGFGAWQYFFGQSESKGANQYTLVRVLLETSPENRKRLLDLVPEGTLAPEVVAAILNAAVIEVSDEKIPETQVQRVLASKTPKQLAKSLKAIDSDFCRNVSEFNIENNLLRCSDGKSVQQFLSPNTSGKELTSLQALVFHFTASSNAEATINFFLKPNGYASAHLVAARDGSVVQLVPFNKAAWHAGKSSCPRLGLERLNYHSIGVELVNLGKLTKNESGNFVSWSKETVPEEDVEIFEINGQTTYWHKYTDLQLDFAKKLVEAFRKKYPDIEVLGHSDINPGRKIDPGPAFPLNVLGRNGLGC